MSEDSDPKRCPCGRLHRPQVRSRKRPGPADHDELVGRIYDARSRGKAAQGERYGEWSVDYAGSCEAPMCIRRVSDRGALLADMYVRCRRCKPCLRARMGFWLHHSMGLTRATEEDGLRTWFGTLTLRPEVQAALLDRARHKWLAEQPSGSSTVPDWWDDPKCDYRFRWHRAELVREMQLYFKRLRKAGHAFKYFVVFERHKSGLPHVHWLLHESQTAITKDELQKQWVHGFTKVKLVGGYDRKHKRKLSAEFASYYVAKYLAKEHQARQMVSLGYRSPYTLKV